MANENSPVIVTYQRLNEKVGKALEMKPDAILDAVKSPVAPKGYEAFESNESPATDAEAARLMEELTKALKYLEAEEHVAGVLVSPSDRFTAVLQSYLAENSLKRGRSSP